MSRDLRGSDPTPTEVHFVVASKDAGKRQRLIDLMIQERQAKTQADKMKKTSDAFRVWAQSRIRAGWDGAGQELRSEAVHGFLVQHYAGTRRIVQPVPRKS